MGNIWIIKTVITLLVCSSHYWIYVVDTINIVTDCITVGTFLTFSLFDSPFDVAVIEERFLYGKHRENGGIQFSRSTLAFPSLSGRQWWIIPCLHEDEGGDEGQQWCCRDEWRGAVGPLTETMKRLSFDERAGRWNKISRTRKETRERNAASVDESGRLCSTSVTKISADRRFPWSSVNRRGFHWWKIPFRDTASGNAVPGLVLVRF